MHLIVSYIARDMTHSSQQPYNIHSYSTDKKIRNFLVMNIASLSLPDRPAISTICMQLYMSNNIFYMCITEMTRK